MKHLGIKSYKQYKPEGAFDALIIGSGMGSLACAGLLAKDGQRVLVLERHYTAGGFTHVFKRNGYEWDVGIHYIGGLNYEKSALLALMNYISDGQLQWADMGEVYDRIWFGAENYDLHKGKRHFAERMKSYFPKKADHRAIDLYMDLVKQASDASQLFFAEKALPPTVAKLIGGRLRKRFLQFSSQTTREVLEELTDNQKLIGVLTAQFGDYGLSPKESSFAMHALVANHYFYGGSFPVGGSARIAESVAQVVAKAGGVILTNAEVKEVVLEGQTAVGVTLTDNHTFTAPLIISGIGVLNTYQHLLPKEISQTLGLTAQTNTVDRSVAHMGLYLGFKESTQTLGLNKANYWIYPANGYDHDANVANYLADPEADFPVVYVSFPSAKDPHWNNRYPNRATVDVITLAPYDWFRDWENSQWKRRGAKYEDLKAQFTERLLSVLFQHEPQLEGKIDHCELSTPLSTRDFVNYQQGEIYGLSHTPERFEQRWLRPHTPIKNFYLTGQDIVTAGVGGAAMSGVITLSAIKRRNYIKKIMR